jgi:hypothetical protein
MSLSEASETFLSVRAQEGFSRYTINAYRLQHQLLVRDIGPEVAKTDFGIISPVNGKRDQKSS